MNPRTPKMATIEIMTMRVMMTTRVVECLADVALRSSIIPCLRYQ